MVVLKEAGNMFWGLTLEDGKRYSQTVEQGFHISMAALEVQADADTSKPHSGVVSVWVSHATSEFLVCSLNYKSVFQQPLDMNFVEGEEVTFFVNGHGTIHLTGYNMEEDDDDLDETNLDDLEMESDMSSDEAPELVSAGKKRKMDTPGGASKKIKWVTPGGGEYSDDEESDDDGDSDLEDDDFDESGLMEFESDEDEDEEESDEDTPAKPAKKDKPTPSQKGKQTPKDSAKKQEQKKEETPKVKTADAPASSVGADGDSGTSKKKKKKKKKKKNKQEDGESENKVVEEKKKTPSKPPKKQVLAGGTVMEEVNVGAGAPAKKGKMANSGDPDETARYQRSVVLKGLSAPDTMSGYCGLFAAHVYYVGKIASSGKQFDSCQGGKPFRFKLGMSEVIQGWDRGLEGMKVGGKRRLTVPPQQGYGSQKQGPIPPNSTLIFDIELKNVS